MHQVAVADTLALPQQMLAPLREVTVLTPVMQSQPDFLEMYQPVKHSYRHGSQLAPLPPLRSLPGH